MNHPSYICFNKKTIKINLLVWTNHVNGFFTSYFDIVENIDELLLEKCCSRILTQLKDKWKPLMSCIFLNMNFHLVGLNDSYQNNLLMYNLLGKVRCIWVVNRYRALWKWYKLLIFAYVWNNPGIWNLYLSWWPSNGSSQFIMLTESIRLMHKKCPVPISNMHGVRSWSSITLTS